MIQAGDLDRRVTIERASTTTDEYGNSAETWNALATVWAKVDHISDGEKWKAAEVGAHVDTRFLIRWGFSVTPLDRVVYESRAYSIKGVKEIGRREGQEITASARAD